MSKRQFSTHANNPKSIDVLHDGVPEWMQHSIDEWIRTQIERQNGYRKGPKIDSIRRLERLLRVKLIGTTDPGKLFSSMFARLNADNNLKLDVVDGILQVLSPLQNEIRELEDILEESGSKWRVAETESGNYQLEERVDSSVIEAMDDLTRQTGDASKYMKLAWRDVFGRKPNPSSAYSNTIKAIEAASWQTTTPSNSRATLGTIIRELTDHPERFQIAIAEKSTNKGVDTLRENMSIIWEGQTDRHGTSNPLSPSQESAEQAVFMGLSICQQFIRGLISRAP